MNPIAILVVVIAAVQGIIFCMYAYAFASMCDPRLTTAAYLAEVFSKAFSGSLCASTVWGLLLVGYAAIVLARRFCFRKSPGMAVIATGWVMIILPWFVLLCALVWQSMSGG